MTSLPSTSHELLPLLLQSINTTLTSLRSPSTLPPSTPDDNSPSTIEIRSDFSTLLSILSKQSTNLTLALKPPPDEKATYATLDKMRDAVEKLKFLMDLLKGRKGELDKRLRWALIESLESLSSFLTLSTSYLPPKPTSTSPAQRQQLLSSCKTLWKVSEKIERDLPASELDAVRKSWRDVVGLLEDCEKEIKEMVEQSGENDGFEGDEEEEEEEEEVEKEELSENTKEIILNSHTLLRLSRLLINRLITLTNSTTPTNPTPLPKKFESAEYLMGLTMSIKRISEKADDLAGVLEEAEDEKESVKKVVDEIVKIGEKISREIQEAYEEEEGEGSTEEERGKSRKQGEWFGVWRGQRDKAHESILTALR